MEELCHKLSSNKPGIPSKNKWWLFKLIINSVNYKTINKIIILLTAFNTYSFRPGGAMWEINAFLNSIYKSYTERWRDLTLSGILPTVSGISIFLYGAVLFTLLIYVLGLRDLSYGPVKEMLQSYDVNKYLKKIDQEKKKVLKKK